MASKIYYFILILCISGFLLPQKMVAQPRYIDFELHGCRYTKNKVIQQPLSAEEEQRMLQTNSHSDSIDILHYAIDLDVTNFSGQTIKGNCQITFTPKVDGIEEIVLDLLELDVDSVGSNGNQLPFTYDGNFVTVDLNTLNIGDTSTITISYQGQPVVAQSGFGGMDFDDGIVYNLGIGLGANPYNYGRGWFPCFDNFVERSTYDINITSAGPRRGYAIGTFLGEEEVASDTFLRSYSMVQPLPTYLVGVAAANYGVVHQTHEGVYGEVPIELVGKLGDTTELKGAFEYLGDAIDAFEFWFGPYVWEKVGFVMTPVGAMEHSTLIAYPDFIIQGGNPTFGQNRLMAHELAHHWWGNITTLSSPADMWIKEGNAEYGAHLFTEYTFGKEAFLDQVKDNFYEVMNFAHIDDGDYLPLSGLPYENTYGTHTYNKGASMMHNLRSYLGDSLFSSGMTSMLNTYTYDAINAAQFRDHLSTATGIDMTSFFDDWIYSPGYSNFEFEYIDIMPVGNDYQVDFEVQQRVLEAPHLHTNVPMEITFFDENWVPHTYDFMASDEFSQASFTLPFEPVAQVMNFNQKLNMGRFQEHYKVYEPGNLNVGLTDMFKLEVLELPDSAMFNIVHHWTAPDEVPNPDQYRISSTHYWSINGDFPEGFLGNFRFQYNGSSPNDFDYDLAAMTEDSILLLWRPTPDADWEEYPHYTKTLLGANNGLGFLNAEPILPGDYAFANGTSITLDIDRQEAPDEPSASVFPNPSTDFIMLEMNNFDAKGYKVRISDQLGRNKIERQVVSPTTFFQDRIDLSTLNTGTYHLQVFDELDYLIYAEQIVVVK